VSLAAIRLNAVSSRPVSRAPYRPDETVARAAGSPRSDATRHRASPLNLRRRAFRLRIGVPLSGGTRTSDAGRVTHTVLALPVTASFRITRLQISRGA
jgi:hypothetical protein